MIVEIVCLDTCAPYTSARCAAISPWVNPLADNEITSPSTPDRRRCRLRTICGSNDPSRSRGIATSTGPMSVSSCLGAGAVAGVAAVAAGRIVLGVAEVIVHLALGRGLDDRLVSCASSPPSPVNRSPCERARSTNCPISCSSEFVQLHHASVCRPQTLLVNDHISHSALLLSQELHRLTYRPADPCGRVPTMRGSRV